MLLIAHGGAGGREPEKHALKKLSEALSSGYRILHGGGDSLEAVMETIAILEDSGIFNAGVGGKLQLDGIRRLDASLMEGRHLRAGSVIGLEGIRNPIRAARCVMDLPHVMLTTIGARRIAEKAELAPLPEPDKRAFEELAEAREKGDAMIELFKKYFSTVGAVALDSRGDLAAGASTGGVSAMLPGRVGDTPIIGAGIYAENSTGAVSCTGTGETIIRLSLAKEICMDLKSVSPYRASVSSLKRLSILGGNAGVVVMNRKGRYALVHTTEHMASGYADKKGVVVQAGFRRVGFNL
jgi:beta-aspartyl-peptidase (threonine type)